MVLLWAVLPRGQVHLQSASLLEPNGSALRYEKYRIPLSSIPPKSFSTSSILHLLFHQIFCFFFVKLAPLLFSLKLPGLS